ncbi:MAG: phytoene/squalene synthase family protein [Halobacteriales archaeon]
MSVNEVSGPARGDVEWCYEIVQDVSRTFALTIGELEEPLSREICVGYLLCRVPDTIEDASHIPPGEQIALLERYLEVIDPDSGVDARAFVEDAEPWIPDDPGRDWELVAATPRVMAAYGTLADHARDVIRPQIREMVGGMRTFVDRYADRGGLRLQTMAELEEYCWYVAGTVGMLVTGLLARDANPSVRSDLREVAPEFGELLQLVNVTKDIRPDYTEENNVYVPAELLGEHGLTAGDIGNPEAATAFVPVVRSLTAAAGERLDAAQEWLSGMPETRGNTTAAWAVPYLLAVGTLRELEADPARVVSEGDVKVGREEVRALLGRFATGEYESVGALREEMAAGPLTDR